MAAALLSHPIPLCPSGSLSSPLKFLGAAVHFLDGKRAPALPLHSNNNKKPNQEEERNKQTNPFPLLAWHLLAAFPLLIEGAAGVISNKLLLMKFRAAEPGGAPRHRSSGTLIKSTAPRCSQPVEAEPQPQLPGWWWERGTPLSCSPRDTLSPWIPLSLREAGQRDGLGCAIARTLLPLNYLSH